MDTTMLNRVASVTEFSCKDSRLLGCVDVGYTHLGFVVVQVGTRGDPWSTPEVVFLCLVDLGSISHKRIPIDICTLHHSRHTVDGINHFFQEYGPWLDALDTLLIESQPPQGMKDIESLIYNRFRDKSILVSPRSMHTFFAMKGKNYEERKIIVEKIGHDFLLRTPKMLYEYESLVRQHDVGDAIAYISKYIENMKSDRKKNVVNTKRKRISYNNITNKILKT